MLDAYLVDRTVASSPTPTTLARHRLRLPRRCAPTRSSRSRRRASGAGGDTPASPPNNISPHGPAGVDRDAAQEPAPRLAARPRLPRRPLQRQQRPRGRLHDRRSRRPTSRRRARTSPTRSCSAPAATPATTSSTRDAIAGVTQPLDWAQAFAQKGATLIAGTGYQYGDTDFSSSTASRSTPSSPRSCCRAAAPVSVGQALVARQAGLPAGTPDPPRHRHQGAARVHAVRPADAQRQHAARPSEPRPRRSGLSPACRRDQRTRLATRSQDR